MRGILLLKEFFVCAAAAGAGGGVESLPVQEGLEFEWDPAKAETNLRKHGVSFDEARTVFGDQLATTVPDPVEPEDRLVTTGVSNQQRVLLVVHLERSDTIRIISARKATGSERRTYEEGE